MKTEVVTKEDTDKEYPWVGFHPITECVVFFKGKNSGTLLVTGQTLLNEGCTSESWSEEDYVPCKVTLSSL